MEKKFGFEDCLSAARFDLQALGQRNCLTKAHIVGNNAFKFLIVAVLLQRWALPPQGKMAYALYKVANSQPWGQWQMYQVAFGCSKWMMTLVTHLAGVEIYSVRASYT